jgi:TonB family protein
MHVLKGFLLLTILFLFMCCEHDQKKSLPMKVQPKAVIQRAPKVINPPKTDKQTRRIIPPEIPVIRIDPVPDPRPFYVGEPTVSCPTFEPIEFKADTIYDFAAVMPIFPGGEQALVNYLKTNLDYPEDAKELGIEGKVFVSFVIFEDGSIQQVSTLRGINGNKSCEKEALRLIKQMPIWNPGQNEYGQKIKARMKIPVVFRLD